MPEAVSEAHVVLGRAIREARERAGLSQAEVARRAGMSRSYLWGIETGRRNLTLSALLAIAAAVRAPPSSLVQALDGLAGQRAVSRTTHS